MEIGITITLFFHLIGMASLIGGSLAQIRSKDRSVTALMRDGALTQLATGLVLVGLVQANHETLRMNIVMVKFTFLLIIILLLILGRKKLSNKSYLAICALSIINVAMALFVTSNS